MVRSIRTAAAAFAATALVASAATAQTPIFTENFSTFTGVTAGNALTGTDNAYSGAYYGGLAQGNVSLAGANSWQAPTAVFEPLEDEAWTLTTRLTTATGSPFTIAGAVRWAAGTGAGAVKEGFGAYLGDSDPATVVSYVNVCVGNASGSTTAARVQVRYFTAASRAATSITGVNFNTWYYVILEVTPQSASGTSDGSVVVYLSPADSSAAATGTIASVGNAGGWPANNNNRVTTPSFAASDLVGAATMPTVSLDQVLIYDGISTAIRGAAITALRAASVDDWSTQ